MSKVLEVNAADNTAIEREMTETELQELAERQSRAAANLKAAQDAIQARASGLQKLEALGLSIAEIKALVG